MVLPVDVLGDGPDVILIFHGAFGSRESWVDVAPQLRRDGVRVVMAGHGRSATPPLTTLDGTIDEIVANAEALHAAHLVVLGHSMGGTLLAAAERRLLAESGLASAIYVDAPFSADRHYEPVSALEERIRARTAQRTPDDLRAARPNLPQTVVDAELRAAHDVQPQALAQLFVDAGGRMLAPSFGCPSLLVMAEEGSLVEPEEVALAQAAGAQVQVVPGAGHGV